MPIYEYECGVCGRVEVIQKVSDKPLKECPDCLEKGKHSKVTRMVSPAAFHLKGTGWYKTDYSSGSSSGGSTKPKADKKEDSKKEDSKKEASGESKPAKCNPGCGCH